MKLSAIRTMFVSATICLITVVCSCSHKAAWTVRDTMADDWASNRDSFFINQIPIQEKVYLHLDNNSYAVGDTIWYKAYTVMADDHKEGCVSRILYVELYNEQGYLVERQQLMIDGKGHSNGQFCLDPEGFSGYYELRAYTKWMMNFSFDYSNYFGKDSLRHFIDEDDPYHQNREYGNIFSRVVPVYEKPADDADYTSRLMPLKVTMGDYEKHYLTDTFDIKFYPESGHIIAGHECRVAWEAYNQQLQRITVEGKLMEDGVAIQSMKTTFAGRGMFTFIPNKFRTYTADFDFNGRHYSFPLPEIESEGVAMRVTQTDSTANIFIRNEFLAERKLFMAIMCRGRASHEIFNINDNRINEISLPIGELCQGVNQCTVYDSTGTVYADRLFFVSHGLDTLKSHVKVEGMPDGELKPYEHVGLDLSLTDHNGQPMQGQTFSIAVRDADQLDPTFATGNIMTSMLLESDVKGFIENPDWYFERDDKEHRDALDLLMMVQGWRRYDWRRVARPEKTYFDYLPEQNAVLYGSTYNLRNSILAKKWGNIELTANIIPMDSLGREDRRHIQHGKIRLGDDGRFKSTYRPFYGDAFLEIKGLYENKRTQSLFWGKSGSKNRGNYVQGSNSDMYCFIRKEYFYPLNVKQYSWYETNKPNQMPSNVPTWSEYQEDIYKSVILPEVSINAKDRPHMVHRRDLPTQEFYFIDFYNDMLDMGYYNKFYLMPTIDDGNDYINLDNICNTALNYYINSQARKSADNHEEDIVTINWNGKYEKAGMDYSGAPFEIDDKARLFRLGKVSIITDNPRRPAPYELYHFDRKRSEDGKRQGVKSYINISTDDGPGAFEGRLYKLKGFNKPAQYYQPNYSAMPLPEYRDYRRTLYWNPKVTTDSEGKAHIEFYNNSVATSLSFSAEGVTKQGEFILSK